MRTSCPSAAPSRASAPPIACAARTSTWRQTWRCAIGASPSEPSRRPPPCPWPPPARRLRRGRSP
eukprot:3519481-Prymnesium_polylepis.2